MSGIGIAVATVAIVGLSAFFVAVEFSLMAARRHRLEEAAHTSRAGRAALRNSSELTLLLAGAQLGITVCTLALGAVTKPAVHHLLTPWMAGLGLGRAAADVVSFVLALVIVTFIHLVVGEMAPKSWAIAHPERSAILLSIPMRGFMVVTGPFLRVLNQAANRLVRRAGVEPVDQLITTHDVTEIRALVEHSARTGTLAPSYQAPLQGALELRELTVADLVRPGRPLTAVPADADVSAVQAATLGTGHLRVLLQRQHRIVGVVHVRDTLEAELDSPALDLARPPFELSPSRPLHEAFAEMRRTRHQLAVVVDQGRPVGVLTMSDVLVRLFPAAV